MRFFQLLDIMEQDSINTASSGSSVDSKAVQAVRSGINLRNDQNFWNDFISICGNADGLAELLEVPKDKIVRWPSRIREMLDRIERADSEDGNDKKADVISTGEELGDPNGADAAKNEPADTRPMP